MAISLKRRRSLQSHYLTVVENFDGTADRSDGRTFGSLNEAVPKKWALEELGDALDCEPVTVNQRKLDRADKRRRDYVQRIVKYPHEYLVYDPAKVRVGNRLNEVAPVGARSVGSYGDTFVAPR
jgi:hypothetical protein